MTYIPTQQLELAQDVADGGVLELLPDVGL